VCDAPLCDWNVISTQELECQKFGFFYPSIILHSLTSHADAQDNFGFDLSLMLVILYKCHAMTVGSS
jgi:hypothetical protein